MSNVMYGVDFKRRVNQKAQRAFWIGPEKPVEIEKVALIDTAPAEHVAPSDDPA